jgi:hypothetical protein
MGIRYKKAPRTKRGRKKKPNASSPLCVKNKNSIPKNAVIVNIAMLPSRQILALSGNRAATTHRIQYGTTPNVNEVIHRFVNRPA